MGGAQQQDFNDQDLILTSGFLLPFQKHVTIYWLL